MIIDRETLRARLEHADRELLRLRRATRDL